MRINVSIRVLLELERSIMSINFMIMIASQSEFCWSLRDQYYESCFNCLIGCLNPSFVGV